MAVPTEADQLGQGTTGEGRSASTRSGTSGRVKPAAGADTNPWIWFRPSTGGGITVPDTAATSEGRGSLAEPDAVRTARFLCTRRRGEVVAALGYTGASPCHARLQNLLGATRSTIAALRPDRGAKMGRRRGLRAKQERTRSRAALTGSTSRRDDRQIRNRCPDKEKGARHPQSKVRTRVK